MFDINEAYQRQDNLLMLIKDNLEGPNVNNLIALIWRQKMVLNKLEQIKPDDEQYQILIDKFLDCYRIQRALLILIFKTLFANDIPQLSILWMNQIFPPDLNWEIESVQVWTTTQQSLNLELEFEKQEFLATYLHELGNISGADQLHDLILIQMERLVCLYQIHPVDNQYKIYLDRYLAYYILQQHMLALILQTSCSWIPNKEILLEILLPSFYSWTPLISPKMTKRQASPNPNLKQENRPLSLFFPAYNSTKLGKRKREEMYEDENLLTMDYKLEDNSP